MQDLLQFKPPKTVVEVVLDGFGITKPSNTNAVTLARKPNFDELFNNYPHTSLRASGEAVGLDAGVEGNSEIGHLTLGAGRIVQQLTTRITSSIKSKTFFSNPVLIGAIEHAKKYNSNLHIIGLIGGAEVHSKLEHILALIDLCVKLKINRNHVYVHCITDGRDSPPKNASQYIAKLELHMKRRDMGNISTLIGRSFAMDRDQKWKKLKIAYDMYTKNKGKICKSWSEALETSYADGFTDEYLPACVLLNYDNPFPPVQDKDSIIFANFRADRAIEISRAFTSDAFDPFRTIKFKNLYYAGFGDYADDVPEHVAFRKEGINNTLGEVISQHHHHQLRIAESEKTPHVTFFFNGGRHIVFSGEDRIEIKSDREVATYDLAPHMRAQEITDAFLRKYKTGKYSFILINYANPDMVGHTGNIDAAIEAIEFTDKMIGKIWKEVGNNNDALIITSDHGNSECMYADGQIYTQHTSNPVPFVLARKFFEPMKLKEGGLANVAPTVLALLNLPQPKQMTEASLI